MKNILKTLVAVLVIAMAGIIALGYVNYMDTQKVIKSQKAQIEELTHQNHKDSVELQETKKELKDLKDCNTYDGKGTFHAKVYGADGKEYLVMTEKGIIGNKTVIVGWDN